MNSREREVSKNKYTGINRAEFSGEFYQFLTSLLMQSLINVQERSENGYGFLGLGLKTVVENDMFWSEIGSGFGDPGGTPLLRIPRSTPQGIGRSFMLKTSQLLHYMYTCNNLL